MFVATMTICRGKWFLSVSSKCPKDFCRLLKRTLLLETLKTRVICYFQSLLSEATMLVTAEMLNVVAERFIAVCLV